MSCYNVYNVAVNKIHPQALLLTRMEMRLLPFRANMLRGAAELSKHTFQLITYRVKTLPVSPEV